MSVLDDLLLGGQATVKRAVAHESSSGGPSVGIKMRYMTCLSHSAAADLQGAAAEAHIAWCRWRLEPLREVPITGDTIVVGGSFLCYYSGQNSFENRDHPLQ